MSFTIAVAGKGGTGKTTIAAMIVRWIKSEQRGAILAVDADPNYTFGSMLGMEPEKTIADIREEALKMGERLSPGLSKQREIEMQIQQALAEAKGFDLLTMGRPEGPKCYCYVNHLLRGFLDGLTDEYSFIVIDNEAGMEHLSRRTTNNVDALVVVSEPTVISVQSAERVLEIAEKLPIIVRAKYLVMNRVPPSGVGEKVEAALRAASLEVTEAIPYDADVAGASGEGATVFDLPEDTAAYSSVKQLMQRLTSSTVPAGKR